MAINRCVYCGKIILEGDHMCKQCFEDAISKQISTTDEILKMNLDPDTLSFHNFGVKNGDSVLLLECLIKYYIFKTNMDIDGGFNREFIYKNITSGESIRDATYRLFDEYTVVVNTIESMIFEK